MQLFPKMHENPCDYLLIIKYDEHCCSSQKSKELKASPLSDRAQTRLNYKKGVVVVAAVLLQR